MLVGLINISDREACIFGGDHVYMVCPLCHGFHGAEVLWDCVVMHGDAPMSVILII